MTKLFRVARPFSSSGKVKVEQRHAGHRCDGVGHAVSEVQRRRVAAAPESEEGSCRGVQVLFVEGDDFRIQPAQKRPENRPGVVAYSRCEHE